VEQAFATNGNGGHEEVEIVQAVWDLDAAGDALDLVATVGDEVVGHVLGSWGSLSQTAVIGVAPLAVSPAHQHVGVGSGLMERLVATADAAGLPMLVLLGDPGYYQRFGFEPSGPYRIWYRPAGEHSPNFQVRRLRSFRSDLAGEYVYSWELPAATP